MSNATAVKEIFSNPKVTIANHGSKFNFTHRDSGKTINCNWLGSVDYDENTYMIVSHDHSGVQVAGADGMGYTVLMLEDNDGFNERYVQPTKAVVDKVLSIYLRSVMMMA